MRAFLIRGSSIDMPVLVLGLLLLLCGAPVQAATPPEYPVRLIAERMLEGDIDGAREAFQREVEQGLEIPDGPALATPEIVRLIHEAGATKRLDAAMLLIRALAFSFSPVGSGESRNLFGLFPAAEAIQRNFGSSALPLLMLSGVSTGEAWLQTRIALVMREMGSEAEIRATREAFSVSEESHSTARSFVARLTERELCLTEDPVLALAGEVNKLIEEALERKPHLNPSPPPP